MSDFALGLTILGSSFVLGNVIIAAALLWASRTRKPTEHRPG